MFQEKRQSRQGQQAFCKDTREQTQGSMAPQSLVTYRLCETPLHLRSNSKVIYANDRWHNNSMVTLNFRCIQCESYKNIQTTITPKIVCHINHRQKSWKLQGSGDGREGQEGGESSSVWHPAPKPSAGEKGSQRKALALAEDLSTGYSGVCTHSKSLHLSTGTTEHH